MVTCFFEQALKIVDKSCKLYDVNTNVDHLYDHYRNMKTGSNIRKRIDGRYEARYEKSRDENGRIIYGYCYGRTYEEAEKKRSSITGCKSIIKPLNLLILGAGSHGEEVMELAQELRVFNKISFLDDDCTKTNTIGVCGSFSKYLDEYSVAIPAVGDADLRMRWMKELSNVGFAIPTLVHPSVVISASASIGCGTVICARATIGTGVTIGCGCIISSGAIIDRNVVLNDWSYVECGETVAMSQN